MSGVADPIRVDQLLEDLVRELRVAADDERRDLEAAERELDALAVDALRALAPSAASPVRVQVVPAVTDVHSSFRTSHEVLRGETVCQDPTCYLRRGGCDLGRIGVVREAPDRSEDGARWVYVEDMPADGLDDDNPTRYLQARHVAPLLGTPA